MTRSGSLYQGRIAETLVGLGAPGASPRVVEAWLRLEHGTLDGLGGAAWVAAVRLALGCAQASAPAENEELARSFGL